MQNEFRFSSLTPMKKTILVTGANGQVGMEMGQLSGAYPSFQFVLTTREEMPLDDFDKIKNVIDKYKPQFLVNCAAYTAVDKAESEKDLAYKINGDAPGIVAAACRANNTRLVHISTDYVFNGNGDRPYKEDADTDPVNLYGDSKLRGETNVLRENPESLVIRTAWVYSEFGKNFVKTMLRLMSEKESINVVRDQYGTPTYAADLAQAIMKVIIILDNDGEVRQPGIYHFSNEGSISWYEFALAIRDISGYACEVKPIPSSDYPTPAKRPHYSVLDKSKITNAFNVVPKPWRESLEVCIEKIRRKK